MEAIISTFQFYLQHFYTQDFLLLMGCFGAFFILVFMALFLRRWPTLAVFLLGFSLVASVGIFVFLEGVLAKKLRPHELRVASGRVLVYSPNLYFDIYLKNTSKRDYSICRVSIRLLAPSANLLEQFKNYLRPLEFYELQIPGIKAGEVHHKELVLALRGGQSQLKRGFESHATAVCF